MEKVFNIDIDKSFIVDYNISDMDIKLHDTLIYYDEPLCWAALDKDNNIFICYKDDDIYEEDIISAERFLYFQVSIDTFEDYLLDQLGLWDLVDQCKTIFVNDMISIKDKLSKTTYEVPKAYFKDNIMVWETNLYDVRKNDYDHYSWNVMRLQEYRNEIRQSDNG